ncbi:MAG TPA: PQQ-binding-like beta-propeller repeat protein [Rhizomicrobium sp.]|jgi:outer membrane protein assembly factor BamB|nr:PQQ-binding-like beta-propeller repeat protein [Rhizomicrobium sp.]
MMSRKSLAICAVLSAGLALGGCAQLDTVSSWFSAKKTVILKGQRISILASENAIKPDPDLAAVQVVLPPPYRNPEWPTPGGYASNAMYHLEANGPLQQIWQQDTGKGSDDDSRLTAPPIVADGRIFVLDSEAHVFAMDAQSGKPVWDVSLAPPDGKPNFWNSATLGVAGNNISTDATKGQGGGVAYDGGKLFVTTGFGQVFALDPTSGKQLWVKDLGIPIVNAPVANGGRVFVSSQDNHFVALAADDGRQLWDHTGISESAGILESTSAAVAGEFVIAPYSSGELYALRVQNGRPAWNDMLTSSGNATAMSELDDIAGRPVVDRDMVFAISHSGVMAAINLNSGERAWTHDVGGIQMPWAAGDFVYVVTSEAQLLCLERKDGKVKWVRQLDRWEDPHRKKDPIIWSGPVLVSNRLIVVSSTGTAVSVSPYTGEILGHIDIPDGTYIAPVVANDTLYLLTNDAQLIALR